ncbi:unnamed protein product [Gongylonema pulchrum]|uniref:Transposase n=1 Tax=Gongylonema pulchrum TaxID=637853 RepID=A0A183DJQ5_9BILA|nr:unnamed protein product [Gongylonema pulchrum]
MTGKQCNNFKKALVKKVKDSALNGLGGIRKFNCRRPLLKTIANKLRAHSEVLKQYDNILKEQLNQGIMEKVNDYQESTIICLTK